MWHLDLAGHCFIPTTSLPPSLSQHAGYSGVHSDVGSRVLAAQSLSRCETIPTVLGDTNLLPPRPRDHTSEE